MGRSTVSHPQRALTSQAEPQDRPSTLSYVSALYPLPNGQKRPETDRLKKFAGGEKSVSQLVFGQF